MVQTQVASPGTMCVVSGYMLVGTVARFLNQAIMVFRDGIYSDLPHNKDGV